MTDLSADLQTEIRRLRVRIIGLNPHQLDQTGGQPGAGEQPQAGGRPEISGQPEAGDRPDRSGRSGRSGRSRRETIAAALAEFSEIASGGREVPDLGDGSLADQVVVLLDHGQNVAEDLPEAQREQMLTRLLDAAVGLRRGLA